MKRIVGRIIDFERKSNTVRFFLGIKDEKWGWANEEYINYLKEKNCYSKSKEDYYGDDWDDCPYEHNAGIVYDVYVLGIQTYYFDIDWIVVEPCDGEINSNYCKNDFKKRQIPCIIVIKGMLAKEYKDKRSFSFWWNFLKNTNKESYNQEEIECFYFEDILISGEKLETEHAAILI